MKRHHPFWGGAFWLSPLGTSLTLKPTGTYLNMVADNSHSRHIGELFSLI